MTRTVTVQLTTKTEKLPLATVFAGFLFQLLRRDVTGSASEVTQETKVVFPGVEPGIYTVAVSALDANGSMFGPSAELNIEVQAEESADVPDGGAAGEADDAGGGGVDGSAADDGAGSGAVGAGEPGADGGAAGDGQGGEAAVGSGDEAVTYEAPAALMVTIT